MHHDRGVWGLGTVDDHKVRQIICFSTWTSLDVGVNRSRSAAIELNICKPHTESTDSLSSNESLYDPVSSFILLGYLLYTVILLLV